MPFFRHPRQWLRQRVRRWMEARLPRHDRQELTQRNVYILPTAAGWMLLLTLLLLLLAAINYQINLGYLLTFMLAGAASVGMYSCHNNLRGITLHLHPPAAVFAGQAAPLQIDLSQSGQRPRYGIGMALLDSEDLAWVDIPAQGSASVQLAWPAAQRGLHPCPSLSAQTHYPLGHFRVWTVWCPASSLLVYPQPEQPAPALPAGQASAVGQASVSTSSSGEFDGVRPYRRGDAMKQIVWKKMAKNDALVSRDSQQLLSSQLWLDEQTLGPALSQEQRLSRLAAWVLAAHQQELSYGLRLLSGLEIAPATGTAQRDQCLQALALA